MDQKEIIRNLRYLSSGVNCLKTAYGWIENEEHSIILKKMIKEIHEEIKILEKELNWED